MNSILIVAGIGTNVGKTVISAILTTCLEADYWKPIETGEGSYDSEYMKSLIDTHKHRIHPPIYSLKAPTSPHQAARLENTSIDVGKITLPPFGNHLIIETVGGLLVPLTFDTLSLEVFRLWKARWVLVSQHYLGSINHTLLTIEVLKSYCLPVIGIIFNGVSNLDSEEVILRISQLPCIGRLQPEMYICQQIIQKYADQWKPQLKKFLF